MATVREPARISSQKLLAGDSGLQRGSKVGLTRAMPGALAMARAHAFMSASTFSV